jgi:hypothetical protein
MKKLRFLLLDANIVIKLFEFGLWDSMLDRTEVLLARTVAEREAEFFFIGDERHEIDLTADIEADRLSIVDVMPTDLKKFVARFDPTYFEKLDPGEAESLAYLDDCDDPCLICSSDAIVFRVLAQLGRAEQGISLEETLQQIGLGRDVAQQFRKAFRLKWTKVGANERIRGIGLK